MKFIINQSDVYVSKGHGEIDKLIKLPLDKKIRAVRILREFNKRNSERKREEEEQFFKDNRSHLKPLTDDEFFKMLK